MATRSQLHHFARLNVRALAFALAWPMAGAGPVAPPEPTGPQALRLATAAPSGKAVAPATAATPAAPPTAPTAAPRAAPAAANAMATAMVPLKPVAPAPGAAKPVPTTPIKMAPPGAGPATAASEPAAPSKANAMASASVAASPAPAAPASVAAAPAATKAVAQANGAGKGAAGADANAPATVDRARGRSSAVGCIISPERVAEIGSPVVGIVRSLGVDSGDTVRSGQALVTLQSDVESAGVQAAQARSAIDADIRASAANLELARQRHVRAIDLQAQGFVSPQAIDQAKAEMEVAAQKLQQARGQHTVAQRELGVVRAQLDQRVVKSPFDGVITERYVNIGERVEDRPLMRLAMLDPLRVELVLPANRYGTVARNDALSVQPELPNAPVVTARVTHVDKVIDAASNTFRVRLSLPNPGNKLPAGARCKLLPNEAVATQAAPARQPG
jgi:RND family efflux transporter MFP subunit